MALFKNWALGADAYYCTNKTLKIPSIVDGNEDTFELTNDVGLLIGIDLGGLHPISNVRVRARTAFAATTIPVFGGSDCNNEPLNKIAEFEFSATPSWLEANVSKTFRYVTLQQAHRHEIYEVQINEILTTTSLSALLDKSVVAPNPPNAQFTVSGNVKDQYVSPMNGQSIDIKIYSGTTVIADASTTADINGNFSSTVPTVSWPPGSYVVRVVSDSLSQSLNLTVVFMNAITFTSICTDTGLPCIADVYLDNNLVGTTPLTVNNIPVGDHTYRVTKTGYDDASGTVTVQQSTASSVAVNLNLSIGNIFFSTNPEGATIILDGTVQTQATPITLTGVSSGTHNYILRKDNFLDYPSPIGGQVAVLTNQTTQLLANLTPSQGCIYFSTNPAGADIYIDDDIISRGKTPLLICGLPLGTHAYRLVLDGYTTVTGSIDLLSGQGQTVSTDLTPCTPAWQCEQPLNCYESDGCGNRRYNSACCPTGDVCIKTNPAGASVTIDLISQGKTTALSGTTCSIENIITGLSPGTNNHSYDISLTGYQPNTGTFSIIPGVLNEIDIGNLIPTCASITLTPSKTTALIGDVINLSINVQPVIQPFNVEVRDQDDNLIGSCTTISPTGTCTIDWDTTLSTVGQYTLVANVVNGSAGQCSSDPVIITLQEKVVQAGFGGAGILLIGGLAIGAILMSRKKPKIETKKK